jgi:hypothetical protein
VTVALFALSIWASCAREPLDEPSSSIDAGSPIPYVPRINRNLDILFMIDDSAGMTAMQQKLLARLPAFTQGLQMLPGGLPSVHIAVISSDMGAPSDANIDGCSQSGDDGKFFAVPEGSCTSAGFSDPNAAYITDDAGSETKNFSAADPAGLGAVAQCIALLGQSGCGFEHQLASIDRALGADGRGPSPHPDFVRPDAYLAIVMLTNEDDCSAPPSGMPLPVYSLNGATDDLTTPDGPLANYRCNGGPLGGHLCQDLNPGSPSTAYAQPPLDPPSDATGTAVAPTLTLSNCESNDTASSGLIPVGQLVADIKALKVDPDHQILVAAIAGPPTPYTVQWLPSADPSSNQLWPQIEHSCISSNGDGSFADPAVRMAQFVEAFGGNGLTYSICDDDYASAMKSIAAKLGALISPQCVAGTTSVPGCP